MAVKTEGTNISDVVKEIWSQNLSYERHTVKSGDAIVMGEVCHEDAGTKAKLEAGDSANADCVHVGEALTGDGTLTSLFMTRGPAVVNKSYLNYGAASTPATVDTTLLALNIRVLPQPTESTTQTT